MQIDGIPVPSSFIRDLIRMLDSDTVGDLELMNSAMATMATEFDSEDLEDVRQAIGVIARTSDFHFKWLRIKESANKKARV